LTNSGSIFLAGTNSALAITTNVSLTGGGALILSASSSQITGTSGMRLTSDNLISGSGAIGLGLLKITNSGTITATSGLLTLSPISTGDGFTNTGILRADGGKLIIASGTCSNSSG